MWRASTILKNNIKNCWPDNKPSFTGSIGIDRYDIISAKVIPLENVTYFDSELVYSAKAYLKPSRASAIEFFFAKTVNAI